VNRLFGRGKGSKKKFGGDPQKNYILKNREARIHAREKNDFDLTVIGDALHSRHKVAKVCNDVGIKSDSPLCVGDIPTLFKTMLMMIKDDHVKEDFQNLYLGDNINNNKNINKVGVANKVAKAANIFKRRASLPSTVKVAVTDAVNAAETGKAKGGRMSITGNMSERNFLTHDE